MLNPVSDPLAKYIKDLNQNVVSLSTTSQPQLLSWIPFNASSLSYSGTGNYVLLTGSRNGGYSFGDKVWMVNSLGDNFYFYITDVLEDSIELYPTEGTPAINASFFSTYTIESVYLSKLPSPYGFVTQPDNSTAIRTCATAIDVGTVTPTTVDLTFSILGNNTVIVPLNDPNWFASNDWSILEIDLPVPTNYKTRTPAPSFSNTFGVQPCFIAAASDIMGIISITFAGLDGSVRIRISPLTGVVPAGLFRITGYAGYQFDNNIILQ